tara:strand:- start:178 stop:1818 length:1641 start_codon:yes stop_codon:yes gene_type:complete
LIFIRPLIFIIFLLLYPGCNQSQEVSFLNLKKAFIGWHLKSNPVMSEKFNQLENIEGWRDFSNDGLDEYFADLQRFFIELSQIDRSKLSDALEFEYLVLWSYLRNTIYFENKLNPYRFDLTIWAKTIEDGLSNINLECGTLTAREENILKTRLFGIEEIVYNIKSHFSYPVNILNEEGKNKFLNINNRMLEFLYECEVDSNLYQRWDQAILSSHENLNSLINEINEKKVFDYPNVDKEIWKNGYEVYFGQFLEELITAKELNNEIWKTFSKMLELALPLYLKEYDEPIWVSKQDTLQVLKTVFNSLEKKNVNGTEVVEKSLDIMNDLEYEFKNKYFHDFKYPEFDFKVGDSSLFYQTIYKTNFKNGYRAHFYLPEIMDSTFLVNEHFLKYKIINEIFPGKLNLNIQNSKSSKILKLLSDKIFYSGWTLYVQNLILNSNYIKKNPEVALLMLENKLVALLKLKTQINFFSDEEYEIESNMVFSIFSKTTLSSYWMKPYPNMDYLLLKSILELKRSYNENNENDLNSFNNFLSKHGSNFIFVRQNLID